MCELVKLFNLLYGILAQVQHFQPLQTLKVFNILNENKSQEQDMLLINP